MRRDGKEIPCDESATREKNKRRGKDYSGMMKSVMVRKAAAATDDDGCGRVC